MLSKFGIKFFSFSIIVISLTASSCGRLDPKSDASRVLLPSRDTGCYDKLGDRVSRYFSGKIEAAEWEETFNCVNDQVTFFKKYVRGEVPDGYSQADIAALIRKFLIVNRPVSDAFVASIFDIKASVFGGSAVVITTGQVDEFLRLSEMLRKESLTLLPLLQARKNTPSSATTLDFSDGLATFGGNIAAFLRTLHGEYPVSKTSFLPFARELLTMHGADAALVDKYGDLLRNLKVVVATGSADSITSSDWPTLIQEGTAIGGLLLALYDMDGISYAPSEERDVLSIDIAKRAQLVMNRVIARHGSGIPLSVFDPVIDSLPGNNINQDQRAALKKDLRPIVFKVLKSGVENWFTSAAVKNIIDLFESGMRSQIHLKRIYRTLAPDSSPKDFEVAARKYLFHFAGFANRDLEEVNSLIEVSKSYVGLFPEGSAEMQFTNARRGARTQNHMIRMSWFKLAIQHLFTIYATGPEISSGIKSAREVDLTNLTVDFVDILRAWKLAHPKLTAPVMAGKRFREGNLFMPNSNGDSFFDPIEATYYLAFLISSSAFSGRIFTSVTENHPGWSACPITGVDELELDAVDAKCFREVYFGNPSFFWGQFPGLQVAYAKMTSEEKASLAYAMEVASRKGGYSEDRIGRFDVDSFAALPHYVEDMMERFDENDNEVLDKNEILDKAYPIFKETLAKASGGQTSDVMLKGLLTYIVKYGRSPSTTQLLIWIARLPFTNVIANRNALYNVVALLSSPTPISKNTTGSSWPIGDGDLFPTVNPQH